MAEDFITLEEAATFEQKSYETLKKRAQRNLIETKPQPRESGGKSQVMVSVASLSQKAQRAYKAAQDQERRDAVIEQCTDSTPWYVDADLNYYIEHNKAAYYQNVELAAQIQTFINYDGPDRTEYAAQYAAELGISLPTLYRYAEYVTQATAWALRLELEDGHSRDYFRVLSLCRKPRERDTFPSLTPEQRAIIENIWFDKKFARNQNSVENLYEAFEKIAAERGWKDYSSIKTVHRYVHYIMNLPPARSAHTLVEEGRRAWENKMQIKGKRTTATLEVMEYVVADGHTLDFWVSYIAPNGKRKAIRPVLVAWMDVKTRRVLGAVLCEHSNAQIVKESFIKMCYEAGIVPMIAHMDNGKDFTAHEMIGQGRNRHCMDEELRIADFKGFYLSMGAQKWSRSLPYRPWDKDIERAFETLCNRFSRKFDSYTGTLTGSKTSAKVEKDIPGMFKRGELLTIEEAYGELQKWLPNWYDVHVHRGLKDAGEQYTTPISLWENAPRYIKAPPPREYAAMLLMKADTAAVTNQGITRFKTLYTAPELGYYVNRKVNIRWDVDNVTKLYVYEEDGKKICEAYSAKVLEFGDRVSQEDLERLFAAKNRNYRNVKDFADDMATPYEQRIDPATPAAVGKLDLMIGHKPKEKIISLPVDHEFSGEMASRSKKKRSGAGDEFLSKRADDALARLRAIGE